MANSVWKSTEVCLNGWEFRGELTSCGPLEKHASSSNGLTGRTRQLGQCTGTDSDGTHRGKRSRFEEQFQMAFGSDDELACAVSAMLS